MSITLNINLVIGDWSHDGHGMCETVPAKVNLSIEEIEEAYLKGSEILGFNLIEDFCRNYEDNKVPIDIAKKLIEIGLQDQTAEDDDT